MKYKSWDFWRFTVSIAAPKTVWWTKTITDGKRQLRIDHLFGIDRTLVRRHKDLKGKQIYIYTFHLWRLKISYFNFN